MHCNTVLCSPPYYQNNFPLWFFNSLDIWNINALHSQFTLGDQPAFPGHGHEQKGNWKCKCKGSDTYSHIYNVIMKLKRLFHKYKIEGYASLQLKNIFYLQHLVLHQTTNKHKDLFSTVQWNSTLTFFYQFSGAILGQEYFLFFIFSSEQMLYKCHSLICWQLCQFM